MRREIARCGDLVYHIQGIVGYATSDPDMRHDHAEERIYIRLWHPSVKVWRNFYEPTKNLHVISRKNEWCPDFDTADMKNFGKWVS